MLLLFAGTVSKGQTMSDTMSLNRKQQSTILIAAFTANGNIDELNVALNEGLDAGLTVNEIKELLAQMYAYAGFPRSLNGIFAFMSVLDERKGKGIQDEVGRDASPVPPDLDKDEYGAKVRASLGGQEQIPPPAAWQEFSPTVDTFLKEHLFADIFVRDILDFQSRELATVAALASMNGTEGQLRFHLGAAMNTGLNEAQMKGFVEVIKSRVGNEEAERASNLLGEILKARSSKH
jgi:4-carboxymuconolactone decarboxylase